MLLYGKQGYLTQAEERSKTILTSFSSGNPRLPMKSMCSANNEHDFEKNEQKTNPNGKIRSRKKDFILNT